MSHSWGTPRVSLVKPTRVLLEAAAQRLMHHHPAPINFVTSATAPLLEITTWVTTPLGSGTETTIELRGGTCRVHAALLEQWYQDMEAKDEIDAERRYELHLESPDPAYYAYCQANGW